jgi:hypothetical protein
MTHAALFARAQEASMRSRSVRSFVLSLVVTSVLSIPAMATVDRDGGDTPILQKIVRVLKHFFTPTTSDDTLSVPKP